MKNVTSALSKLWVKLDVTFKNIIKNTNKNKIIELIAIFESCFKKTTNVSIN